MESTYAVIADTKKELLKMISKKEFEQTFALIVTTS